MRTLLLTILSLSLLAIPALAEEERPFYQWTNPATGALEFTDDEKHIPESVQDQAIKRDFVDLEMDAMQSKSMLESKAYMDALNLRLERYRTFNSQEAFRRSEETQDFPERRLRGTRSLGGDLTVGGGKFVTVQERFRWDGIDKSMWVTYGPDGEVVEISPTYGGGVYSGSGDGFDRSRKDDRPDRDFGYPNPRYRANFILGDAPPLGRSIGIRSVDGPRHGRGQRSGHGKKVSRPSHRSGR